MLKVHLVGQFGDGALLDQLLSGRYPSVADEPIKAMFRVAAYAYVGASVAAPSLKLFLPWVIAKAVHRYRLFFKDLRQLWYPRAG